MISDEERREVALRLRELQSRQFRDEDKPEITTWEGIGAAVLPDDEWQRIDRFRSRDNRTRAVRSVIAGRLADLIEPGAQCPYYRSDRHYCSIHDVPAIDRDALLALADEMQRELDECASNHEIVGKLQYQIDRIREALGVES